MSGHNNTFSIEQIRPWNTPTLENSISIITPHQPTRYPIGLTHLAISNSQDTHIKSYIDDVEFINSDGKFSATVHIDAWPDSILWFAACTWFPIPNPDREFQNGKVTIKGNHFFYNVSFEQEYASIPKVVLWLNGLDIGRGAGWHVYVEATGVTLKGFTLKCTAWNNIKLHHVEVAWIAYPASRNNIESGVFSTNEVADWTLMNHQNPKAIKFTKAFERPPKVYFALSGIDSTNSTDLRVKAYVTDVTSQGMNVHLDSWAEQNMRSARGHWIAIQEM